MYLEEIREAISRAANDAFPREACGFVLGDGSVVTCNNVAADPFNAFEVSEEGVVRWWETGLAVHVWHSHPYAAAVPSEEDEEYAAKAGLDGLYLVYSVTDEDLGWYRLDGDGRLQMQHMQTG